MGDSYNIGLAMYEYDAKEPKDILWLYAHNGFWNESAKVEGFAASLAVALDEARPRWNDHSYFNRIVIHTLGESVRGISIGLATLDMHKRYLVDSEKQKVYLMDNYYWNGSIAKMPQPIIAFTFEDFITKYRKHDKTVRNEY